MKEQLVFLHGAMVEAGTYQSLTRKLEKYYRVYAPDLPGFGNIPTPEASWRLSDYAEWVNRKIETKNLKNLTVVGHSFGGGVAAWVAATNKNVSRLVLVDAAGIPGDKRWNHYIRSMLLKTFRGMTINPQVTSQIQRDAINGWLLKHWQEAPRQLKIIKETVTNPEKLPQIQIPTLVVWGKDDEVFNVNLTESWKKAVPQASVKIVEGNHDWLLFNPETLVEMLIN